MLGVGILVLHHPGVGVHHPTIWLFYFFGAGMGVDNWHTLGIGKIHYSHGPTFPKLFDSFIPERLGIPVRCNTKRVWAVCFIFPFRVSGPFQNGNSKILCQEVSGSFQFRNLREFSDRTQLPPQISWIMLSPVQLEKVVGNISNQQNLLKSTSH